MVKQKSRKISYQLETKSADETKRVGRRIGKALRQGDVVLLLGELGAGKTCLTQGIAMGMDIKEKHVSSPSFVIIKEYRGKFPLYHIDFFRLQAAKEIELTGYDEYICGEGVTVIEWAEKIEDALPEKYFRIELVVSGKNKRLILFKPVGEDYERIARDVYEDFGAGYLKRV
jgi:tRNA threonylcarbamoyladenosine biosynthesis protein TsaE